ncbi:MAG TPA: DUF559 domain-containing protein [Sphingomicrobium sp.]|nr:DUF559 domain-containing protein [Sphingomicrobium sp.]
MKRLGLEAGAIQRARHLRRRMTDAERILWRVLRDALPELHWRKQVPLGRYYADFASHAAKIVIEVDGGRHAAACAYDEARTRFIEGEGYRLLRFWNKYVLGNTKGVVRAVALAIAGKA